MASESQMLPLLESNRVVCAAGICSKKHALDQLSQALASTEGGPSQAAILDALTARERLGSTALGNAIAVPHAKVPGLEKSIAAFLKLQEPVDFDASDGVPVDLLFAVLMPADTDCNAPGILRSVMQELRDTRLQNELHETNDPKRLHSLLADSLTGIQQTINV